jgi:alkylation response protein AidB-like acyl-CoA dehydrogenase
VLRALGALGGTDPAERTRLAAAAKVRTAQAGRFVTGQAIQLHGGIGVTEEYALGRHFRRVLAYDLRHGTAATHIARFAVLGEPNPVMR